MMGLSTPEIGPRRLRDENRRFTDWIGILRYSSNIPLDIIDMINIISICICIPWISSIHLDIANFILQVIAVSGPGVHASLGSFFEPQKAIVQP